VQLTPENKAIIDNKSYKELLHGIRFLKPGDPWLRGRSGTYWNKRMKSLREEPGGNEVHVKASKSIGWG
jgi:hypothetical protein